MHEYILCLKGTAGMPTIHRKGSYFVYSRGGASPTLLLAALGFYIVTYPA